MVEPYDNLGLIYWESCVTWTLDKDSGRWYHSSNRMHAVVINGCNSCICLCRVLTAYRNNCRPILASLGLYDPIFSEVICGSWAIITVLSHYYVAGSVILESMQMESMQVLHKSRNLKLHLCAPKKGKGWSCHDDLYWFFPWNWCEISSLRCLHSTKAKFPFLSKSHLNAILKIAGDTGSSLLGTC